MRKTPLSDISEDRRNMFDRITPRFTQLHMNNASAKIIIEIEINELVMCSTNSAGKCRTLGRAMHG